MIEFKIVYFLNHLLAGTWVDNLTKIISNIYLIAGIFLGLTLLNFIFNKKNGRWIFLGSIIIAIIYFFVNDQIIKYGILEHIFVRERPYLAYPNEIISSGEPWHDSSFPSGHMAFIVANISFLLHYFRKNWLWIIAIVYVSLIAFARMHNGMHYPSDILVGLIFGVGYGLLTIYVIKKIRVRYQKSP